MYSHYSLSIQPIVSSRIATLPFRVLLAIPPYISSRRNAPVYNLIGDMNLFLGSSVEWERKIKVIQPQIWAPSWNQSQLKRFISPGFTAAGHKLPTGLVGNLRVKDFPLLGNRYHKAQYEIVHFIGYVSLEDSEPALHLEHKRVSKLRPGALRDVLVDADARLFILQVPVAQYSEAMRLAETITGAGGPAVLVVVGASSPDKFSDEWEWWETGYLENILNPENRTVIDDYFFHFYLDIVHNNFLPAAAEKPWLTSSQNPLTASLFYGAGAESILQVSQWMDFLASRLEASRQRIKIQDEFLTSYQKKMSDYLHNSQIQAIEPLTRARREQIEIFNENVSQNLNRLDKIKIHIPDHESEGALPLTEVAETVSELEEQATNLGAAASVSVPVSEIISASPYIADVTAISDVSVPVIEEVLNIEAQNAPRVLNANFEDLSAPNKMLDPRRGLLAGQECVFLLDVGPVWDTIQTIVVGIAEFPIYALPQELDGWDIQVTFVSDDFTPKNIAGKIFVPAKGGRSFPYDADNHRAETSGPLALRLTTPDFPEDSNTDMMTARGRLCLYYENNLLQSAIVTVGVVRSPDILLAEKNAVEIDYRLTGGFQKIEKFSRRSVQFGNETAESGHPVKLNLTINSDGANGHRILIKKDGSKPGIAPYNPVGAPDFLNRARLTLKECFNLRDKKGFAQYTDTPQGKQPVIGLNKQNGKTREQFKLDLFNLAILGQRLFNAVFNSIQPEGDGDAEKARRKWKLEILKTLESPSVIQIARTKGVSVEYVFPWALIYQHLLPVDMTKVKYCKAIDEEWSEDGVRIKNQFSAKCTYNNSPGDHDYVLCPYGFWGLRHIIEQPLTSLQKRDGKYLQPIDALEEIPVGAEPISLAVGVTRDKALPKEKVDSHLSKLKNSARMKIIPPGEAETHEALLGVLSSSQMVYFLCHGEFDSLQNEPYIGIGLRDNNSLHRVYPQDLNTWSYQLQQPNLSQWEKLRPLVFINGCHTCNLEPSQILNFVSTLVDIQAGGIIGTEVSVLLGLAAEVAELILSRLTEQKTDGTNFSVGEAIYWMRWNLVNKGSFMGLAYTPYCLSSLHFAAGNK